MDAYDYSDRTFLNKQYMHMPINAGSWDSDCGDCDNNRHDLSFSGVILFVDYFSFFGAKPEWCSPLADT